MSSAYSILDRKRRGERLAVGEIEEVVAGAADGSWSDAQLAAFLMAAAVVGLDAGETQTLTSAMLASGERWALSDEFPTLADKHSTGGVGDKISLILAPVLAACDVPVAMLTGRGLGHTAGTADKLEGIPGLDVALSRTDVVRLLDSEGMAIGMSTTAVAPADRKLYSLRDVTGTVVSVPLIVSSIVSKKVALGAKGIVYDVKTGSGAFLSVPEEARRLAEMLVETTRGLGVEASALVTDMSQPLGRWVGHDSEVGESLTCLAGEGPEDLAGLVVALAEECGRVVGVPLTREAIENCLSSGSARERFMSWATAQGAAAAWCQRPTFELAPVEVPIRVATGGRLARIDTREIGLVLAEAGGGRKVAEDHIDHGVAFRYDVRLGDELAAGDVVGLLYLRRPDEGLVRRLSDCFEIADQASPPALIRARVDVPTDRAR